MRRGLTDEQRAAYQRDGFLFPLPLLTPEEAKRLRGVLEATEAEYGGEGRLPKPLPTYLRTNPFLVMPEVERVLRDPAILDAVESLLGPDLLVWGCEFFIKEAGSDRHVGWHQDLTYWGLGSTEEEITVWIALSPATPESGCMRFMAGSHTQELLPHRDTYDPKSLVSRGQVLETEIDEAAATPVVLAPGEASLHHGRMFHASGPNVSDDRRIGLAIRYVTPHVKNVEGKQDYAMLVRGFDREDNFLKVCGSGHAFDAHALALYDEFSRARLAVLSTGAAQDLNIYAAAAGAGSGAAAKG